MNINRHNYEEFFLLYIDGELDGTLRSEVEKFIQQNADLAGELQMLQRSVLPPDEIMFDKKDVLFKKETTVSIDTYENFFLLSVDDELTSSQKNEVERFVLQHPELQNAFTLLHNTKLPAETIVFKEKTSLYRSEKKERRIIAFTWLRMSAVAAVLVIIGGIWFLNRGTGSLPTDDIAIVRPNEATSNRGNQNNSTATPASVITANKNGVNNISNPVVATVSKKETAVSAITFEKVKEESAFPPENSTAPGKMLALIDKTPEDVATAPIDIIDRIDPKFTLSTNGSTAAKSYTTTVQQPVVTQTAYNEIEDDESNRTLYIGPSKINKNKLKSIFKKASSLFQKKDRKNDEGGKTINIASFEFKSN